MLIAPEIMKEYSTLKPCKSVTSVRSIILIAIDFQISHCCLNSVRIKIFLPDVSFHLIKQYK